MASLLRRPPAVHPADPGPPLRLITLSRQFGAGASELAALLGGRLGWRVVDRELVAEVARRLAVPAPAVEAHEERVEALADRVGLVLADSFPEMLLPPWPPERVTAAEVARVVEAVLGEVLRELPAIVVGFGAQCLCARRDDALHLRLQAPLRARTARAVARLGISSEEAVEEAARRDEERRAYVRHHYGRDPDDPSLYHLVVDTAAVPLPALADLVVTLVRARERPGG